MTLRLPDADVEALRAWAAVEGVSMQAIVQRAVRRYLEEVSRAQLVDRILDSELPRYAEAIDRLSR